MLLVDTNIWLAAADRRSESHQQASEILSTHRGQLAAPVAVIAEAAWLILDRLGTAAQQRFLRLVASEELSRIDLTDSDWVRVADLCDQYSDLGLDVVDASIVAVAERLDVKQIATLNRRDFTVVQPSHTSAFDLLP